MKESEEHGTIVEKYDIERRESDDDAGLRFGHGSNEVGFGWTNGAFLKLLAGLDRSTREPAAWKVPSARGKGWTRGGSAGGSSGVSAAAAH